MIFVNEREKPAYSSTKFRLRSKTFMPSCPGPFAISFRSSQAAAAGEQGPVQMAPYQRNLIEHVIAGDIIRWYTFGTGPKTTKAGFESAF